MEQPIEKPKTMENILNKEPVTPEVIVKLGLTFDRYFGTQQSTPIYEDWRGNQYMFKHEGDAYTLITSTNPAYRVNQSFWKLISDNF